MAYVVRKAGSNMSAAEIMEYIEKQVLVKVQQPSFYSTSLCPPFKESFCRYLWNTGGSLQENTTSCIYRLHPEISGREDSPERPPEACVIKVVITCLYFY